MVITRKYTLYPQGDKEEVDRVYRYIRNGMEIQSQMMNMCMSALYSAKLRKADKEEIKEISHLYSHTPTSKLGSAYSELDNEKYPTGLPIAGSIPMAVKKKLDKACKDGLMYGRVSLPTYKKDMPLMVHNDFVNIRGSKIVNGRVRDNGLYHDYDDYNTLYDALENDIKPLIHIKFVNDIVFDFVLGNPHKSREQRIVLRRAFEGDYKICDSTIGFDKRTGKKIELNLSLNIPVDTVKLDENVTVGVDLGLAVPAVCALNNNLYAREYIGDYQDFTKNRTKIQAERKRIQKALVNTSGGHGRKKKLLHLDKISLHERNFAKTQNHIYSREIIKFALKNKAKYINMENLSGFGKNEKQAFVLRNWSYYELQTMIQYKAKKEGIEVRFVNPVYTSQTCSVCGDMGIRESQSVFKCNNPDCKCHKIYKKFNADFNGARNIAMSTDFVK